MFTDAVFFIVDGVVVKEMMTSEFDALLDGIVDAPEFRGRNVQAVHIQIDDSLMIRGAVFFWIGFTSEGMVEADWNIPVHQLIQGANRGPDLGGGKIRIVCASQCNVPWHQQNLWDPTNETLQVLVTVVKQNKLGLLVDDESFLDMPVLEAASVVVNEADIPVLDVPVLKPAEDQIEVVAADSATPDAPAANASDDDVRKELSALKAMFSIKVDKLHADNDHLKKRLHDSVETLKRKARDQLARINNDHDAETARLSEQLQQVRSRLSAEQQRYIDLKEQQAEMSAGYQLEREKLLDDMQAIQAVDDQKIGKIKSAFETELAIRLDQEVAQTRNELSTREVEIFYRDEEIAILKNDLAAVQRERQNMLADKDTSTLKALEDSGVTLVAFQLGLGHINIPVADVSEFLDNKTSYLARRSNISTADFHAWQAHYNNPVCQFADGDGQLCGVPLARVDQVVDFTQEISNQCEKHRLMPARNSAEDSH
ncbi:Uncharacterised protein [BD1-7 clade bacterium]|uniref:Uncharacterized protein n=1 Tax=BD1-7 clade bacterium TaxID=2029982 RepID=A0A5S9QBV2_9GAMM|nr:Uncharacterised protein [BD1-7 clade bacterium]CAA0115719.1 Uncharacterised protein [BD1-7 clade bacterium]CAA0119405.1 Uncharacterised protein [BD1-7 clade bacterium]